MMTTNPEYLDIAADYTAAASVLDRQIGVAMAASPAPGMPLRFTDFWPPAREVDPAVVQIIQTLLTAQISEIAASMDNPARQPAAALVDV